MSGWYYSQDGQQIGPVAFEMLLGLVSVGRVKATDLVWHESLKDWVPACDVPELAAPPPAMPAVPGPTNPYATPSVAWPDPMQVTSSSGLEEIVPGSEPIDVGGCIGRGFELTKRHFGTLFLIGLVYLGIMIVLGFLLGMMDHLFGWGRSTMHFRSFVDSNGQARDLAYMAKEGPSLPNQLIAGVVSLFLSLGCTRIGLNLVSGKAASVSMIFGEGSKMLRAIAASILYYLMVVVGLVLLIVPGIYVALRFGFFRKGILDRDLGVIDSLKYSWEITENNTLNLFGLAIFSVLIVLAGFIALLVGAIFAVPLVWLAETVAYRWMQYGHQAAMDHPGTLTPMLSEID